MSEVKIANTSLILNKLENAINSKTPFGIIRFGDGTIKAIHAYLMNDTKQLYDISVQEGIPMCQFDRILDFWKTSADICDFIDSPQVYFDGKFWPRTKSLLKKKMSKKTIERLKMWLKLYKKIGITNTKYCNPEINFLSCIAKGSKTLPDIIQDKNICIITSRDDVLENISSFFKRIDVIKIPGKYEDQFTRSFSKVVEKIDSDAKKYDLWLVCAGELGRVYPGLIKFKGGIAFDIGSLVDFWCTREIPSRLLPYLTTTIQHPLKLKLTKEGRRYLKYL